MCLNWNFVEKSGLWILGNPYNIPGAVPVLNKLRKTFSERIEIVYFIFYSQSVFKNWFTYFLVLRSIRYQFQHFRQIRFFVNKNNTPAFIWLTHNNLFVRRKLLELSNILFSKYCRKYFIRLEVTEIFERNSL